VAAELSKHSDIDYLLAEKVSCAPYYYVCMDAMYTTCHSILCICYNNENCVVYQVSQWRISNGESNAHRVIRYLIRLLRTVIIQYFSDNMLSFLFLFLYMKISSSGDRYNNNNRHHHYVVRIAGFAITSNYASCIIIQ
jgi:hypothetical protein